LTQPQLNTNDKECGIKKWKSGKVKRWKSFGWRVGWLTNSPYAIFDLTREAGVRIKPRA